jgi:hypothetical protein
MPRVGAAAGPAAQVGDVLRLEILRENSTIGVDVQLEAGSPPEAPVPGAAAPERQAPPAGAPPALEAPRP